MGNICLAPTGSAEPGECELLKRGLHNMVNNVQQMESESGNPECCKGLHNSKLTLKGS